MTLDPSLTAKIQKWLETPAEQRDLRAGADILFSLTRNRALHNTILRSPERHAVRIEDGLKKFLRIRLDGMTTAKIVEMEREVMPAAQAIIDTSDERPEAKVHPGRRADHDQLPAHIRELWDENGKNVHMIKLLFEELKAMNHLEPCDRYDKLQLLASVDAKYHRNLEEYDNYVLESEPEPTPAPETPEEIAEANTKRVNAARKTLSKYRKVHTTTNDEDKKAAAAEKARAAFAVLVELGQKVSMETSDWLLSVGVEVPESAKA